MGKLNEVLQSWPSGTVAVQTWFDQKKIVRQLSQKYVKGGWVEKIGPGAYIRAGDKVDWRGGVYALQQGLGLPIHVGGKTALELMGRSHFVPLGNPVINLYTHGSHPGRHLPKWFSEYFKAQTPQYFSTVLFRGKVGLQVLDCSTFKINISSMERALFEILALTSKNMSLDHAFLLFQGQETLRADLIQALLQDCQSQVLKRLFLYLAKQSDLPWLERLDIKLIDLGQGKRKVGLGDYYDPEFKLFVPKIKVDEQDRSFE